MQTLLQVKPMKISFTDQQIIDGLKEGSDEDAHRILQTAFYHKYSSYVYKVALNKCRNFSNPEDLAKDILQETFKNAFRALNKFSFPSTSPADEHINIIKAWLGRIGNNCFNKVYEKRMKEITSETSTLDIDEIICPLCSESLVEENGMFVCDKGHYKVKKARKIAAPLPEDYNSFDLFESLYGDDDQEITNEFRQRLQVAMNSLNERQKHILLTYANEGCLGTKSHISDATLVELCRIHNTTSDNIKHIKNRALAKVKSICFPENG
jgi:RNA polymerase sigma factor (sigma-70 family)